jgi:hypothetical protein
MTLSVAKLTHLFDGSSGLNGEDGKPGPKGNDGRKGDRGDKGDKGDDGKDAPQQPNQPYENYFAKENVSINSFSKLNNNLYILKLSNYLSDYGFRIYQSSNYINEFFKDYALNKTKK